MAQEFTLFMELPPEIRHKIWEEALGGPGIHFIELYREGISEAEDRYPPAFGQYPIWHAPTTMVPFQDDPEIIARDPRERTRLVLSSHHPTHRANTTLRTNTIASVCAESRAVAARRGQRHGVQSVPVRHKTDANEDDPVVNIKAHLDTDLVCLVRTDPQHSPSFIVSLGSPLKLGEEGRFCRVFPELAGMKHVAFEWDSYEFEYSCETCHQASRAATSFTDGWQPLRQPDEWCVTCSGAALPFYFDFEEYPFDDPDAITEAEDAENDEWADEDGYLDVVQEDPSWTWIMVRSPGWHACDIISRCMANLPHPFENSMYFCPSAVSYEWVDGRPVRPWCNRDHIMCFLSDLKEIWHYHMLNLETIYILDRSIRLRPGRYPSTSTRRFNGNGADFFEVNGLDFGVWDHPDGIDQSRAAKFIRYLQDEFWRRYMIQVQRAQQYAAGFYAHAMARTHSTAPNEPIDTRYPPQVRLLARVPNV